MQHKTSKVVLIGIDAADQDLIGAYVRAGVMPTFRRLPDGVLSIVTKNPSGLYIGAVWPSFWSGLSPSYHGRYCYEQFVPGTYDDQRTDPSKFAVEPFWDRLSDAGCRVAIVDVPKTSMSARINGIQVVDWGTHDGEMGFTVSPASLGAELAARHGAHPIGNNCDALNASVETLAQLRDGLLEGIRRKRDLSLELLRREDWDCFVTVFGETHCAGHQFWHLQDAHHPRYTATPLEDAMRQVYVTMDAAVATLIGAAGPDAHVMVFASHGMGPHYDASFVLDDMLQRMDRAAVNAPTRAAAGVLDSIWEALPNALRKPLRALKAPAKRALRDVRVVGQRSSRKYFSVPNNDHYGAIRLNLVGREPEGLVGPGDDYERVCRHLERELLAIRNVETGAPLVKAVHRVMALYPAEPTAHLPDLFVEWERGSPIRDVESPAIGRMKIDYTGGRTGDHKPEGLLLVVGPGIVKGRALAHVRIQQISSTIEAMLGVTLRTNAAPPIPELLEAAAASSREAGIPAS